LGGVREERGWREGLERGVGEREGLEKRGREGLERVGRERGEGLEERMEGREEGKDVRTAPPTYA
jgi:hypothetical protein